VRLRQKPRPYLDPPLTNCEDERIGADAIAGTELAGAWMRSSGRTDF
jgi:hypothetical protein